MTPDHFRTALRAHRSAAPVLQLFRGVAAHARGLALEPYLQALMAKARNLNEGLGLLDEAIPLWREVHAHAEGDGKEAVVRTLMSVAGARLGGRDAQVRADVPAAVRLYEAAFALGHSPDQCMRVVKTMMSAANRFSDTLGPPAAMDITAAVQLWTGAWRLRLSPDDQSRVVRTMMDVANRLSDATRSTPAQVGEAVRIWRALGALGLAEDDHTRLCRTIMDVANRMRDADRVADTVLAWRLAHDLDPLPDGRLRIRKTMMSAANGWTPAEDPGRHLDHALAAWTAVAALSPDDADRTRVVATMNTVAGRLSDLGAYAPALRVFRAIGELTSATSTQKSLAARGAADPSFRDGMLPLLGDTAFDLPVKAALLYYAERFEPVLEIARRSALPALRALGADALRKLHQYDDALRACATIAATTDPSPVSQDARLSALSCAGYCLLEKTKGGEDLLAEAEAMFLRSADAAASQGVAVPPRVNTGLGYVYQLQRRADDAAAAFARARADDPDNAKAAEALASPSPHLRVRPFVDLPNVTTHPDVLDGIPTVHGIPIAAALRRVAQAPWHGVEGLDPGEVADLLEYAARVLEGRDA